MAELTPSHELHLLTHIRVISMAKNSARRLRSYLLPPNSLHSTKSLLPYLAAVSVVTGGGTA
jgi:hypothetical protein